MEWQATDQFGNLYVGESDAQCVEDLVPHLALLLDAVRERAGDSFRITVDFAYHEVTGPDPEQVSHVLRVPWLAATDRSEATPQIQEVVSRLCEERGLTGVTFGAA